jgi:hypothetical protein
LAEGVITTQTPYSGKMFDKSHKFDSHQRHPSFVIRTLQHRVLNRRLSQIEKTFALKKWTANLYKFQLSKYRWKSDFTAAASLRRIEANINDEAKRSLIALRARLGDFHIF